MKETSLEELNQVAMQIILHAGDCRKYLNEAIDLICSDASEETIQSKMNQAKVEVTKAHQYQTEMIQDTISEENQKTCLLFTHAQDTLMTINSEFLTYKNLIRLYRKLEGKKTNEN